MSAHDNMNDEEFGEYVRKNTAMLQGSTPDPRGSVYSDYSPDDALATQVVKAQLSASSGGGTLPSGHVFRKMGKKLLGKG